MINLKNSVILHFHIYKNAGSTIDWILEKNLGKKFKRIDFPNKPEGRLPFSMILNYLRKNPTIQAISSHHLQFPVFEDNYFQFLPIIFIRHPIDRAFSMYSFKKYSEDGKDMDMIMAKTSSLKEYIQWNLSIKTQRPMKNWQVLFLSDKTSRSISKNDDFDIAKKRMIQCTCLGVVDRIEESLVVAEENLYPYFENIDLSYVKQNVSKGRKKTLQERLMDEETLIGSDLANTLYVENRLDMALYLEANKELNRRIMQIKNFQQKLEDFKIRCKKLSNSV
jgi:hypothetical protein